ncbi:hypothetical protein [Pseudoxanthomonas gei]|nr:hypothetical protein [Pseudoxanthomonas gei]
MASPRLVNLQSKAPRVDQLLKPLFLPGLRRYAGIGTARINP